MIERNGNTEITFPVFLNLMTYRNLNDVSEQQLLLAFNVFDKDQSGHISTEDFRQVILNLQKKLSQKEIEEIMTEANKDGDNTINYLEFAKMMMGK